MINFDTRCYCDVFCCRNSNSDCCPDGAFTCSNTEVKSTTPSAIYTDPITTTAFGSTYRTIFFDNNQYYDYEDGYKFINSRNLRNL